MNMDLLLDKSWRDVSEIWLAYHRKRDETLSAVIPLNQFNKFYNQSIKYPMVQFVLIKLISLLSSSIKCMFLVYITTSSQY